MKPVRFPNSATVRAPERFVLRGGRWGRIDIPVRYGVFDHPVGGRCLVDTGYSARVTAGPRSLLLRLYASVLGPKLTAEALPAAEPNVDTILLTHLHADHVSALKDYPGAKVYADVAALDAFLAQSRFSQLRHGMFAELLPDGLRDRVIDFASLPEAELAYGLGIGRDIFGDGSVLAAPLPGHMQGHTGIVWMGGATPLLYAADAEWMMPAVLEDRSPGYPARFILHDRNAAQDTARRIRTFVENGGKVVLCHDPEPVQ